MCNCKILSIVFVVLGIALIVVGAVVGFVVLDDDFIKDEIKQQVILENGTDQYERWEELPFALTFKVYIFNVTNPDEVLNGEKAIVEEIGPYIYSQNRKKYDIERNETEDTLFYYQNQLYIFDEEASFPYKESDTLTVLFAPMMGILQGMEGILPNSIIENSLDAAFPNAGIFSSIIVKEYLFDGYRFCIDNTEIFCEFIRGTAAEVKTLQLLEDGSISFAFLNHKNNSHDGSYKINAGIFNVEDVGFITEWEGSSTLSEWTDNSTCSLIKGRDSTIYPPFIDKTDTFEIFNTDICRVVTLEYVDNEEYIGIDGQRRQLRRDTLANTEENECYCGPSYGTTPLESSDNCFPDGFMDLYTCMSSKVILSFPHFLWGDDYYKSTVNGLEPNEDDHVTFVVIEPNTGTPLRGAKRVQFNMILRPMENANFLENVQPAIIPLIWIEEGMELPDDLVDELKSKYFNKLILIDAFRWTLIAVGIFLVILGSVLFFWKRK